jgi:hypothetical protein
MEIENTGYSTKQRGVLEWLGFMSAREIPSFKDVTPVEVELIATRLFDETAPHPLVKVGR